MVRMLLTKVNYRIVLSGSSGLLDSKWRECHDLGRAVRFFKDRMLGITA